MFTVPRSPIAIVVALFATAVLAVVAVPRAVSARGNTGAPVRQTSNSAHTIAVQGHGETTVAPDEATITVGVQTRGPDAQTALSRAATKMDAVISAIEGKGIPASHIQTSDLSLWYDSQSDSYVASHQVTVKLDNVDSVGDVLDSAVAAGADNSWGVSFGLKDQSAAKAKALANAVADARSHADSIASALGVSISGVGSASEATYQYQPITYAAAAPSVPSQGAPTTPVQPGELTITADVNVTYTF